MVHQREPCSAPKIAKVYLKKSKWENAADIDPLNFSGSNMNQRNSSQQCLDKMKTRLPAQRIFFGSKKKRADRTLLCSLQLTGKAFDLKLSNKLLSFKEANLRNTCDFAKVWNVKVKWACVDMSRWKGLRTVRGSWIWVTLEGSTEIISKLISGKHWKDPKKLSQIKIHV